MYTVSEHWRVVRDLGCCITRRPDPTLHHCHGGSMRGIVHRGIGQKTSDWLVIPLDIRLHSMGPNAIDGSMGVVRWERKYGRQLDWLRWVSDQIRMDVFMLAEQETMK